MPELSQLIDEWISKITPFLKAYHIYIQMQDYLSKVQHFDKNILEKIKSILNLFP